MGLELIELLSKLRFFDYYIHLFKALHFVNGCHRLPDHNFVFECYTPSLVGAMGDADAMPVPSLIDSKVVRPLKVTLRVINFYGSKGSAALVVAFCAHLRDCEVEFNGVLRWRGS